MPDHPEACPGWHEDLGAWLVAQIGTDREALLDDHMTACHVCRTEAESLLAVTAVSLGSAPDGGGDAGDPPPAGLGDRIVERISAERRARRVVGAGLVAIAGAAAAVVLLVALRPGKPVAPISGEDVAFTVAPPGAAVHAVIADDGDGSIVQLTAIGLDPGVTYALWLSPPGGGWEDRVAAGTFRPDDDGTVETRLRCALPADEYGRAWATTPEGQVALDTG